MNSLGGIGPALALTARRERVHAGAWFGCVGLLLVAVAASIAAAYPTQAARAALAASVNASAGELFLIGPLPSTDVGGVALWRTQGVAAVLLSLASIFTVVRNTRAAEENGTIELLSAGAVGRAAPLAASLTVAAAGSVLAGLIVGAGFLGLGTGATGGLLVGAQTASYGLLSAVLAGITAQVVRTARAATGSAVALVVAFYLLRGTADATGGGAGWLSPFRWIAAVRPFDDRTALMLLPSSALTAVLALVAVRVAASRDLGAGLLPDRAGHATASVWLRGPVTVALRVSRATIAGWTAAALAAGLLIGTVASTVDKQVALTLGGTGGGGAGLTQVVLHLSPLAAAALGVQTALRLRGEVTSGRAEAVLSLPVTRSHWLLAHALAGAAGSLAVLVALGLGLGAAHVGTTRHAIAVYTTASGLRAPAAWVFVALSTVLLGAAPRAAAATTFAALGGTIVLEFAVEFGFAPTEVLRLSPLALVTQLPYGPDHALHGVLLVLAAAALAKCGTWAARRGDLR